MRKARQLIMTVLVMSISITGLADEIVVPEGYEVKVLIDNVPYPGALLFTPNGKLTVGLYQSIITISTDGTNIETIATGDSWWALDVAYGLMGHSILPHLVKVPHSMKQTD